MLFSGRNDATPPRKGSTGGLVGFVRDRIADEAFQRYLDWRDECATVEAAYRNWSETPAAHSAFAFAAYAAALEREECAAVQYQALIDAGEGLLEHQTDGASRVS
jgi:hypothetical protein